ncbi:TIR-like protein FxsC [Frankia sp. Cr1]|uniref:TIR-like protein FxsC n=1 Tax=Frankia sp. Cr1 TaxID=3073931 RepID=UPI002AD3537A|nr:TIR-like protein FxsC [Frankia sp. Cr1]
MFFLSYAHTDGVGGWVRDFYLDLCDELTRKTTLDPSVIGFQDVDMRSGTRWADTIADELAHCQAFVPLYSPRYFNSEFCGREWQAFSDRLDAAKAVNGKTPPLIFPLLWEPPILWEPPSDLRLPEVAGAVQYREFTEYGIEYKKLGLMKIVKNKKDPSLALGYDQILSAIVLEIKKNTDEYTLAPAAPPPELETTRNAFAKMPASPSAPGGTGDSDNTTGPHHVHFVVASGTATELARKSDPDPYYGTRPTDWSPFLPHDAEPLVRLAAAVAIDQKMTPYPEKLDGHLVERLDDADRENELVVLLVDPRVTDLPDRAGALRTYDNRFDPNSAVMINWNVTDTQSAVGVPEPKTVFPKKTRRPDQSFHARIHSPEEFRRILVEVLVYLQKLLLGEADSSRTAATDQYVPRPQLNGSMVGS